MMEHSIVRIANGEDGSSCFEQIEFELIQHGGMFISERQQALNFRHRKSKAGYESDRHVA